MENIIDFLKKIKSKVQNSFLIAWKGKENLSILINYWGIPSLLICYFVINPIIKKIKIDIVSDILCAAVVAYYIWHIIVLKKCSPKKPKLSKEEERELKEKKRKNRVKSILRKITLKESVIEWNPVSVMMATDLFALVTFADYLFNR